MFSSADVFLPNHSVARHSMPTVILLYLPCSGCGWFVYEPFLQTQMLRLMFSLLGTTEEARQTVLHPTGICGVQRVSHRSGCQTCTAVTSIWPNWTQIMALFGQIHHSCIQHQPGRLGRFLY